MYSKLKACVRLYSNYSDIFTDNVGLMQGESLSSLLYSLYVNDIEVEFKDHLSLFRLYITPTSENYNFYLI
jgi:hypothetical protein